MKEFIEEAIKTALEVYKIQPDRISADYQIEQEAMKSYQGREIFELIQNADDEMRFLENPEQCCIQISYSDGYLMVSNNGEPFTQRGVKSLMLAYHSGKKEISQKTPVIGNKGTGFRAVLSWADKVVIHSNNLHIAFSSLHSQKTLEQLSYEKRGEAIAATLAFPEWINEAETHEFTTEIGLRIKDDSEVKERVVAQLERLDGTVLLFLNYAKSITVRIGELSTQYRRIDKRNEIVIEKSINGSVCSSASWILRENRDQLDGNNYSIAIAYRKDGINPEKSYLYSYLPTEVPLPLPILMHATLELDGTRNHLVKNSKANKLILSKAAELLVATAVEKASRRRRSSYDELRMLVPQTSIQESELQHFEFWNTLHKYVLDAKILPTVNDEYISVNDYPFFYEKPIGKYLSGSMFDQLLKPEDDQLIVNYFKSNSMTDIYPDVFFSEAVNKWSRSRKYSAEVVDQNCELIDSIIAEGVNIQGSLNLIYCTDKKLTTNTNLAYLDDGESHIALPLFTNMRLIDPFMESRLLHVFDDDAVYMLNNLKDFNLRKLDIMEVIKKTQQSVEQTIKKNDHKKAVERTRESVYWILENCRILSFPRLTPPIYLVTRMGAIEKSDRLYYGSEYGNPLIDELFHELDGDRFVELESNIKRQFNLEEVIRVLEAFGVASMPRDEIYEVKYAETPECTEFFWNTIKYPIKFEKHELVRDSLYKKFYGQFHTIEHLEWILENCSTETILKWIKTDERIRGALKSRKDSSSSIKVKFGSIAVPRDLPSKETPSYIAWLFEKIPWIEVNGKRYRICDCIMETMPSALSGVLVQPDIPKYIESETGKRGDLKKQYELIFSDIIGVCTSYGDLSADKLYAVLNEIGSKGVDSKEAKPIYSKIYEEVDESFYDCDEALHFHTEGLVLCQDGKYYSTSESYYLDKRAFCKVIKERFHLIDFPTRLSSSRISGLFGVGLLDIESEIVGTPTVHVMNNTFQNNLENYKTCVCCYRYGSNKNKEKEEFGKIKKLRVVLCSEIQAKLNGELITLDNYDYVHSENNVYYLCVPNDLIQDNQLYCHAMGDAISGIVCDLLNLASERTVFRDLFMKPIQDRLYAVRDEAEEDDIFLRISREIGSYDSIRSEFLSVLVSLSDREEKTLIPYLEKIDFDNFSSEMNAEEIIHCFSELNIDADDYNELSILAKVDLRSYYFRRCREWMRYYLDSYKMKTYTQLLNSSLTEKRRLVDIWYSFEDAEPVVTNSVYFKPENSVCEQFGILEYFSNIDALNDIYNKNLSILEEKSDRKEDLVQFCNNNEITSLLYFGSIDELTKLYRKFVSDKSADDDTNVKQPVFSQLSAVTGRIEPLSANSVHKHKNAGFDKERNNKKAKSSERVGYSGELRVYDWLMKHFKQVRWVSENAKKAGVNPTGSASYGYDISYMNDDVEYYVDVKSSKSNTNDIVFFMSSTELAFAQAHADTYRIFFVSNVDSDDAQLFILEDVIRDGELNSKAFRIDTTIEYKLSGIVKSIKPLE